MIPGLPRLNVAAKATSSDLGAYHIFTCSGTGTGRSCDVYTGFKDALTSGSVYASLKSDAVTGTLVEYAEVRGAAHSAAARPRCVSRAGAPVAASHSPRLP